MTATNMCYNFVGFRYSPLFRAIYIIVDENKSNYFRTFVDHHLE